MANKVDIKAVISADDKASGVLSKFGDTVGGMAKTAGLALAGLGAAFTAVGVSSVKSYEDSQNAAAQLDAVLKSTGKAAGVTADQLNKQASALQKVTTFSDEAVSGAQSLLLTFTNVKGQVFEDSIPLILDMSQALGQDLKSSTIQLGKALQDPIKGITALSRVGVTFTEKQKDTIKALVDTGKTAEAQRVILKELRTEFGGSAAAAGQTFAGSMTRLKNQMDDVKESIGKVIVDAITPFTGKVAEFLGSIDWETDIKKAKLLIIDFYNVVFKGDGITSDGLFGKVEQIAQKIRDLGQAAYEVGRRIEQYLEPKFVALWHTLQEKLMPALEILWKNVIEPLIPIVGTVLVGAFGFVVDAINFVVSAISNVIIWMDKHRGATEILIGVLGTLAAALAMNAAFAAAVAGFTTLTEVVIPAMMVKFAAMSAVLTSPITLAVVSAAALAAIASVVKASIDLKKLWGEISAEQSKLGDYETDFYRSLKAARDSGKISEAEFKKRSTGFANSMQGGYASGGFTGIGGKNEVAGIVHKGEYVVPQEQVNQATGMPKTQSTPNINISFNGIFTGNEQEFRKLAVRVFQSYQDAQSMGTI